MTALRCEAMRFVLPALCLLAAAGCQGATKPAVGAGPPPSDDWVAVTTVPLARGVASGDVISRSATDLQTSLDSIVLTSCRLLQSDASTVLRYVADGSLERVASAGRDGIREHSRLAAPTPIPADQSNRTSLFERGATVMRHGGPEVIEADEPELAALWRAVGINSSIVPRPLQLNATSRRSPPSSHFRRGKPRQSSPQER